jgi:hypothetical protein
MRHQVLPTYNKLILEAAQAYERSQTISLLATANKADDLRLEYERRHQAAITARMELARFVMSHFIAIKIDLAKLADEVPERADLPTKGATP